MEKSNLKVTYHQEGDYLIPDLVLPKVTNNYQIGKYGYLRLEFLKEHKRGLYTQLLIQNKLNKHLFETDKEANFKVDKIIKELAKKENINTYFNGNNALSWVQKMNNIKNRAEEIVFNEIIYC